VSASDTGTIDIGRVGIWTGVLDAHPIGAALEMAQEVESLGYGALWIPEAVGRDPFVLAAMLLGATRAMPVATGIVNIWARDAMATANAHRTLNEAFPNRFLLGLGVSHDNLVEGVREHEYRRPLAKMAEYLDFMKHRGVWRSAGPAELPPVVLAALGPRMLELAAAETAGAHPYFQTPEHTATAREIMGPDRLLAPEQMCVLSTDAAEARALARRVMSSYVDRPNYANNLLRMGFTHDDLSGEFSDRLVDAIVVWGDAATVATRVAEHHAAGADHVCVQVLTANPREGVVEGWRELAPALLG
jgi:probable F420-dependent oxidoreductase